MDGLALLALVHARALTNALLRVGVLTPEHMTEALSEAAASLVADADLRAEICFALDESAKLH